MCFKVTYLHSSKVKTVKTGPVRKFYLFRPIITAATGDIFGLGLCFLCVCFAFCASRVTYFSQIEGLWQPCIIR